MYYNMFKLWATEPEVVRWIGSRQNGFKAPPDGDCVLSLHHVSSEVAWDDRIIAPEEEEEKEEEEGEEEEDILVPWILVIQLYKYMYVYMYECEITDNQIQTRKVQLY